MTSSPWLCSFQASSVHLIHVEAKTKILFERGQIFLLKILQRLSPCDAGDGLRWNIKSIHHKIMNRHIYLQIISRKQQYKSYILAITSFFCSNIICKDEARSSSLPAIMHPIPKLSTSSTTISAIHLQKYNHSPRRHGN